MGDSQESKLFEVSREVANWTIAEGDEDFLDNTESYWSLYSSSANGSFNGSAEGNKTAGTDYKRDEDLAKVEMAVLALIFILTVLGNCVVLLGIFFRRQKMTRMYYFILHLSVADLITAFFNVLAQFVWEITYRFQGGNFLCKFVKYTQILGPYSSSYVLVMTAMDRYQAICYPLSNCTWTAKRSKVMLGLAWTISVLFCVPQIFIFSYQLVRPATDTLPAEYDCWATFPEFWGDKAYVTWYSITVFVIPLIILIFAYSCITRAIWINFNMKAAGRNHDNYERRMTRQDSDDGDGPSQYEHSVDESVFQRDGRHSLRANASHSVGAGKKSLNINLYNPSKHFLTTKSSTTSSTSGGGIESSGTGSSYIGTDSDSKGKYRDSAKRGGVNNIITRISTSSCTTQSSTLSPNISGRFTSALEDKSGGTEHSKNPHCLTSQKLFTSNGSDGLGCDIAVNQTQPLHYDDEEQLHLIPTEYTRNELRISPTTRTCETASPTADRNDFEANAIDNGPHMRNGSVKLSGAFDTCHHGCYGKRCNFCHLSVTDTERRFPPMGTNTGGVLSKELLITEVGETHAKQSTPSPIGKDCDREKEHSYRFTGSSSVRHLLLPNKSRFSRKGNKGKRASISGGSNHQSTKSSMATYVNQQPRTHSVKGISRAKIKTIKLTVTIICCYIFCSSPFIAAQLWAVFDPYASSSPFFTGPTFTILTLLASLNSCVNPYIFLFFNPNLLENCYRGIFRPKFPARRFNNGSPLSRGMSQSKKAQFSVAGNTSSIGKYNGSSTGASKGATRANHQAGSGIGVNSQTTYTSPINHSSSLISREEKGRSHQLQSLCQIPSSNGFEKGYLEKLAERNESAGNVLELVDSTSTTPATTNGSNEQGKYSPTPLPGSQPCGMETALVGKANHVSTSTLIT